MRHIEGGGVWTADISPPCTELGKNVPWRGLQGRCPCGSLAKLMNRCSEATLCSVERDLCW